MRLEPHYIQVIPDIYRIATQEDMPDPVEGVFVDESYNLRCSECGHLLRITPFNDGPIHKAAVCLFVKCSKYQKLINLPQ